MTTENNVSSLILVGLMAKNKSFSYTINKKYLSYPWLTRSSSQSLSNPEPYKESNASVTELRLWSKCTGSLVAILS